MRRLAAVLLALVAMLGLGMAAAQPTAADDGPISDVVEGMCDVGATTTAPGLIGNLVTGGGVYDMCEKVGEEAQEKANEAWDAVWDSVLGDVITSGADVTKWVIRKVFTVSLMGPSLDLAGTGLFGEDATLAGILTWFGLVVATAGAMWQIGKMAVTGQAKHLGRAALGWVENVLLSAVGVSLIAVLLSAGDALTAGLVDATFSKDGDAYETIVGIMVPATAAVHNPVTMLCVVVVLLLIGFIQLVMVFLRQAAIPIQCLLLPVAAGGRVGGDATRQWAPRLITSILVVIAYKPILAVIICVGFSELGNDSHTLADWLRGCATFVLAILAPGPLTKLFAPFGAALGSGLATGGIGGALGSAADYFGGLGGKDGKDGGAGAQLPTPMDRAKYVEQSMGRQGSGGTGGEGEAGRDAQTQAARNEAGRVPAQGAPADGATAGIGADTAKTGAPGVQTAGAPGSTASTGGTAAAGAAGIAIQIFDGVNNALQGASNEIANGGNTQ
ncbi:hypothetical protein [Streptomyces sp. NPDC088812]|uniref:hypothetical protein n=1 Tax=Streptomyces sp. NPDC088812 TaxID=3365905 RepID=UPI00381225F2